MPKQFTIVGFIEAFKKPSRTKAHVASSKKSGLEKAVKKKNAASFKNAANDLYLENPNYFVELLGYKLAKHWDADGLDIWLNESPPAAVEAIFDKLAQKNPPDLETWKTNLNMQCGIGKATRNYASAKNKNLARSGFDDPRFAESLRNCSAQNFRASLGDRNDPKWSQPWIVGTVNRNAGLDKLGVFGEFLFAGEGQNWNLGDGLASNDFDELAISLESLGKTYERTIKKYDTNGTEENRDKWDICQQWGGEVLAQVYERRDALLRQRDEQADELVSAAELEFGFSSQLDSIEELNEIDVDDQVVEAIRNRLRTVSPEPYLFDTVPLGNGGKPNDCKQFSRIAFNKLKGDSPTTSVNFNIEGDDEQQKRQSALQFGQRFASKYGKSQGVARLQIVYSNDAMCEFHWRTVVGQVGDKYLTVEANIGKKFMMAPEVLCLTLDELLCGDDDDALHRTGFTCEFLGAIEDDD